MGVHQKMNEELKNAMKTNNENIKNYTRSLKSKLTEFCVANKIDRNTLVEDNILISVIISHKKSLEKAIELFGKDEKAKELIKEYESEIKFCEKFLPDVKDELNEISKKVISIIEELKVTDTKQIGKVVGNIMKYFKDINKSVDGAVVKKLVIEELNKRGLNGS